GSGTINGQTHAFLLVPAGPTVQSIQINDGSAQRSKVASVTVTFSTAVVPDAGAFTLARRGGDVLTVGQTTSDNKSFVLTFSGASFTLGSLVDGVYDLTVVGSKVHAG